MSISSTRKRKATTSNPVEYANHIRRYRIIHDLTQYQVSVKVGISETTMYQIERRVLMPKLNVANRIASLFGVTVYEMFFDPSLVPPIKYPDQIKSIAQQTTEDPK